MAGKTAIIIGAGPAGLTAALELLRRTDIKPIVIEASGAMGGLSRTVLFKGNRIDLGGHRFFSKSARVIKWWLDLFPLQGAPSADDLLLKRTVPLSKLPDAPDPETSDIVMLTRVRTSRIYFQKKFYEYPLTLNASTISNLGFAKILIGGASYLRSQWMPIRPEKNLRDYYINRFGRNLYETFFRDYTEKVWGVSCENIAPDWGKQRVRGISLMEVLKHAFRKEIGGEVRSRPEEIQTSFIGRFWYPKFGPGHFWEKVAEQIVRSGGAIRAGTKVRSLHRTGRRLTHVTLEKSGGCSEQLNGDYFVSTMPIKDLIGSMDPAPSPELSEIAENLQYRDFIVVGLLLRKLAVPEAEKKRTQRDLLPDQWIYIQDNHVRVGRVQIFNNWSPYLVRDSNNIWIGMEYFCNEGDEWWSEADEKIISTAAEELKSLGLGEREDVLDGVVVRQKKAYPAYFGAFAKIDKVRAFTDSVENLFLIGRNGMHRYNNQDHSMLTAMTLVDNLEKDRIDKANIWDVNPDDEYIEET